MGMTELGIIEGYYGKPWSWPERSANAGWLGARGFRFYMYAPKADPYLRRLWREEHPSEEAASVAQLSEAARAAGMRFGVGLSPAGLNKGFDSAARDALQRKLAELDAMGIDDLALLFDDMRGDVPDLARTQVEIVHWAAERTGASRIIMCPSYYTDDPVLDRVFGARPPGYLDELGRSLDSHIHIFWTGEEVCSRELSVSHLRHVADVLRRKPFIWDNYPVNDGERMSQYLHIRAFTGRSSRISDYVAAHGLNPALQPTLSRIPTLTLRAVYERGDDYAYGAAFRRAAAEVAGDDLAAMLYDDILIVQDIGLDRLGERADALRERYSGIDHAIAREIIAWLDGEYRITDEIVRAQAGE